MKFNISEDDKNKSGIYTITNLVNGKYYIGSAVNFKQRFKIHISDFKYEQNSKHLQNAYNKYGAENFEMQVLDIIDNLTDLLYIEEMYIINLFSYERCTGYNISKFAGSCLGCKRSDETKSLLREINLGKKHTRESRRKVSENNKGKKHKPETIEKMKILSRGQNSPLTKLNNNDVYQIKVLLKDNYKPKEIASMFDVNICVIYNIKQNKRWKHIDINNYILEEAPVKNKIIYNNLTDKEIIEIKQMFLNNTLNNKDLANLYNISNITLKNILNETKCGYIKIIDDKIVIEENLDRSGERNSNSKLTEKDVIDILNIFKKNDKITYTEIGKIYGVGYNTISNIIHGKMWKYLTSSN